jgi:hypothetical protein
MEYTIRLQSREQYIAALRILNVVPGIFHASGPSSSPILVLGDTQYQALMNAGVITANGKEERVRGKKTSAKKAKS